MNMPDNHLLELAQRMHHDYPDQPDRFRQALQANLLPMIRCALRAGIGHPSLVSWVRCHAACEPGESPDPVKAAPPMARVLCERMLERLYPLSGRETVREVIGLSSRASA
jgi:hypothetical protein